MGFKETYDLSGRVALVTGASSRGIGSESAKVLAEAGAKVFLTARREDQLQSICAEIEAAGGQAAYAVCDVSSEEQCEAAVKNCVETFGQLDIMVLSAGISGVSASGGPDAWFDTENWRNMLGVNLDGVFFMIKHGWSECAKGGHGSIIPVGSLCIVACRRQRCVHGHEGRHSRACRLVWKKLCEGRHPRTRERPVSRPYRNRHDPYGSGA